MMIQEGLLCVPVMIQPDVLEGSTRCKVLEGVRIESSKSRLGDEVETVVKTLPKWTFANSQTVL